MSLHRRRVLGAAAAALVSCLGAAAARGPDYGALARAIDGRVVLPGDRDYPEARQLFQPRYDSVAPGAVAYPAHAGDVAVCLDFARRSAVPVVPRGGGHSYAGWSTCAAGLVVDAGAMAGVAVEGDGVRIGAGARLGEVNSALAGRGLAVPTGLCPSVGIAGLTLGGGLGMASRAYGTTSDRLTGARVVTPDGSVREVSADRDPELYWALRGGGGRQLRGGHRTPLPHPPGGRLRLRRTPLARRRLGGGAGRLAALAVRTAGPVYPRTDRVPRWSCPTAGPSTQPPMSRTERVTVSHSTPPNSTAKWSASHPRVNGPTPRPKPDSAAPHSRWRWGGARVCAGAVIRRGTAGCRGASGRARRPWPRARPGLRWNRRAAGTPWGRCSPRQGRGGSGCIGWGGPLQRGRGSRQCRGSGARSPRGGRLGRRLGRRGLPAGCTGSRGPNSGRGGAGRSPSART
ncbi:FAD-dependent oxidoreductase [Streptomyces sp. ISL-94]|nr:FAD-dependent oxidoreductase [Streptomyces sp. ISL-94]